MKKILIVDDDDDDDALFAKIISDTLPKGKYKVAMAENGEEGLRKMESEKPDLILLDILMPKMDGIEFLKILQSRKPQNKGELPVPVIIISNLSNINKISEGVALGVQGYIVKSDESLQNISNNIEQIFQNEEKERDR